MTTGDIKNNLRKLQLELRKVKYPEELDLEGVTGGNWLALEPIYRFAFGRYSNWVTDEIQEKLGFQLCLRQGNRFYEGLYRLLRDLYKYKPPVTKDQFTSYGFAERKIIMCTEILQMVQTRHGEITGKFSRSSQLSGTSESARVRHQKSSGSSQNSADSANEFQEGKAGDLDIPIMEASAASSENDSIPPGMNSELKTILDNTHDENEHFNQGLTFWDFQKTVEKNFNKILNRLSTIESRIDEIENKMELFQGKNRSLFQRVKPLVKIN